jgi:hypothetical protein
LTTYGQLHTLCDIKHSNMRTISVRLSLAEHRLLTDLAGARRVSVEALVREALAFPPLYVPASRTRRLEVVRSEHARPVGEGEQGPAAPIA